MSDTTPDPVCKPFEFNPSFFPTMSAKMSGDYDPYPFLCELMQAAIQGTNQSSLLVPPTEFDISQFFAYQALTAVGDPRFSDGDIIKSAFIKYLPRLIAQIEVKQAGGTQIINNVICDKDGNPKVTAQLTPILTSIGTGGKNLYGYDIPEGLDPNELLIPLKPFDIMDHVNSFIKNQSEKAADFFVEYLLRYYPISDWKPTMIYYDGLPLFYIQMDHITDGKVDVSVFVRYYPEVRDYVAKQLIDHSYLPSNASISNRVNSLFDTSAVGNILITPIPNYEKLINDDDAALANNLNSIDKHSSYENEFFTSDKFDISSVIPPEYKDWYNSSLEKIKEKINQS
jgi:hypothetical protein